MSGIIHGNYRYEFTKQTEFTFEVNNYHQLDDVCFTSVMTFPSTSLVDEKYHVNDVYYALCYNGHKIFTVKTQNGNIPNYTRGLDTNNMSPAFTFRDGDKITCYANGIKMYCTIRIKSTTSQNKFFITADQAILKLMSFITTFNRGSLNEPSSTVVKTVDNKEVKSDPTQEPKPEVKSYFTVSINITRGKCVGVSCWTIPAALGGSLVITFDRDVVGKRLIQKSRKDGSLTVLNVTRIRANDDRSIVVQAAYTYQFWFADNYDELYDVNIVKIEV
jgi:hypothetical protein